MYLFLVRHGETDYNRDNLALGRADVPLNETGRRQAEALARALAKEDMAAVYSSPLRRALDTAAPIASAHGLQVVTEDAFIELDVGELDGMSFSEVREKFPGLLERWLGPDGAEEALGGGERLSDVRERVWPALERIVMEHADDGVCLVTHNFVILALLTQALGLPVAEHRRLRHSVAAISRIDWSPGRVQVMALNDTCHLRAIT